MSKEKTIKVLQTLGGRADIVAIRQKAYKMYPDTQLGRIIHTPLKKLIEDGDVKFAGGRRGHGVYVLDKTKMPPPAPVKTAAQLLEEEYQAAKEITEKQKEVLKIEHPEKILSATIPAPPPIINDYKEPEAEPEIKKTENGVLSVEIEKAIKEPYLDKLAGLAKNVAEKEYKYRGRHDIVYDILRFIKTHKHGFGELAPGVGITEIMYKTMLSHYQLKKYIITLMKNKLIEKTDAGYKITEKGMHYSDTMDSIPIEF